MQRVGGRGERAVVGDGSQGAQAAEVDHEVDLTGSLHKVQSLLRVSAVTVGAMPRRHVLLALAVAVVWGVNFVVIHVGLDHFPPLLFAALRFCLVALALPFVPRPGVPVKYVVAVGVFLSAGQFGLLFLGIDKGMPAGLASLVLQLQAAFTVGLAVLLLKERPKPAQLAGGALALAGIGIIAAGRASAVPLGALALTIGAAASWGFGNVATRKAQSPNPLGLLVWSSLVPPLPLLTLSLPDRARRPGRVQRRPASSRCSTSSCSPRCVGFGAWAWLLGKHPASTVAPFTLLVPVVGIAAAWLALERGPVGRGADRRRGRAQRPGADGGVDSAPARAGGSRIMRLSVASPSPQPSSP